jgi:hypothetical protein
VAEAVAVSNPIKDQVEAVALAVIEPDLLQ